MNPRLPAALLLGVLLLAGCASEVSNLTPRAVQISPTRTYSVEVTWDSRRRGVKNDEVKAWVMVDQTLYPMNRVPHTVNRWEARIPVPEGKTYVPYKFKFEYMVPEITTRTLQSEWSQEYRLVVAQH
ncbi:MAG: hypothetical protein DVB31_04030 [Verrucomicrobia bacterium]|nr:MAG: hypothetical protein DVB31_04030 [Verrucomicrobiota bacterium]